MEVCNGPPAPIWMCMYIYYVYGHFLVCVCARILYKHGSFCRGREGGREGGGRESEGGREGGRESGMCVCVCVSRTYIPGQLLFHFAFKNLFEPIILCLVLERVLPCSQRLSKHLASSCSNVCVYVVCVCACVCV
jgi:hypothetical protein